MKSSSQTLLTAFAMLAAVTAAHAAEVDQSVTVKGNTSDLCMLGSPNPSSIDLGALASTTGADAGHLQTIANESVVLPASFCNYGGTALTVQASALVASDTGEVQPGFTRAVNFTATVTDWTSPGVAATTVADSNGGNASITKVGGTQAAPKLADLTLTLSNFLAPGGNFLVAGDYEGSVTITLGPATN